MWLSTLGFQIAVRVSVAHHPQLDIVLNGKTVVLLRWAKWLMWVWKLKALHLSKTRTNLKTKTPSSPHQILFLLVVSCVLIELMASLDFFCSLELLEAKNTVQYLWTASVNVSDVLCRVKVLCEEIILQWFLSRNDVISYPFLARHRGVPRPDGASVCCRNLCRSSIRLFWRVLL